MIEGDGIGPEIAQSVKDIFDAAKVCPQVRSG
jgi:isocitrate/isopropylmalate dehydrogenase